MRWIYVGIVAVHGLIHFLGFAWSVGTLDLPPSSNPPIRVWGIIWLLAGLSFLVSGVLVVSGSTAWWMAGLAGVALSTLAIASAWSDARYGMFVNGVVALAVVYGAASVGPWSTYRAYNDALAAHLGDSTASSVITESDLDSLPDPLRRYIRASGAVGHPPVSHLRATWRGRIRASVDDPWMEFRAEQFNVPSEPARYFRMTAWRGGLPVDVFHEFAGGSATMRVRLASLVPLVDQKGPEMTQSETVTIFNDLALLAPSALLDPAIRWELIDDRSVRGFYTVGRTTVSAVLAFDETGNLVDFESDNRFRASADGKEFVRQRWSTPVGDYRTFGTRRAASKAPACGTRQKGLSRISSSN